VPFLVDTLDKIVERLMRGFLAGEDKVIPVVPDHRDNGLTGEEVITQIVGVQAFDGRPGFSNYAVDLRLVLELLHKFATACKAG
jgi:hypothetical protein